MADEMTNGSADRGYTDAMTAQLGERVTNLGRRQSDLESEMRSGFKQMETAVGSLASEMRNSVAALSTNMAEKNKPQWQALGFTLTFCTVLGALVYWPINSATTDLKTAVTTITDKMVTQNEMKWRTDRALEDRKRVDDTISDVKDKQIPREEVVRIQADLQRQLDEVKADLREREKSKPSG